MCRDGAHADVAQPIHAGGSDGKRRSSMTSPVAESMTRGVAIDASTAAAMQSDRAAGTRWKLRARSAPYLFLLPYFLVTAVFFLYPLLYAMVLAFYQTNGPRSRAFVGIDNFRFILTDSDFHIAIRNTLFYTVC